MIFLRLSLKGGFFLHSKIVDLTYTTLKICKFSETGFCKQQHAQESQQDFHPINFKSPTRPGHGCNKVKR